MDLDTNVKRFKYSAVKKIICLALCLVSCLLSVNLAVKSAASFFYFDGFADYQKSEDFTDSYIFVSDLTSDVNGVFEALNSKDYQKKLEASLNAEKEKAVKSIFDQFDEAYHTAFANDDWSFSGVFSYEYEFAEGKWSFTMNFDDITDHFSVFNEDWTWTQGLNLVEKNLTKLLTLLHSNMTASFKMSSVIMTTLVLNTFSI